MEDGSRYNPAVISFIRDEWIHGQMRERCVGDSWLVWPMRVPWRPSATSGRAVRRGGPRARVSLRARNHASFALPLSRSHSEAEYTEYRPLRVFVGTWNVNGKFPREDLTTWLCDGADTDAQVALNLPDVYVIG